MFLYYVTYELNDDDDDDDDDDDEFVQRQGRPTGLPQEVWCGSAAWT
jgi:hypothetical protein